MMLAVEKMLRKEKATFATPAGRIVSGRWTSGPPLANGAVR